MDCLSSVPRRWRGVTPSLVKAVVLSSWMTWCVWARKVTWLCVGTAAGARTTVTTQRMCLWSVAVSTGLHGNRLQGSCLHGNCRHGNRLDGNRLHGNCLHGNRLHVGVSLWWSYVQMVMWTVNRDIFFSDLLVPFLLVDLEGEFIMTEKLNT